MRNDIEDLLKQLEEKSQILAKTEEEKEVQEYLVSRHQEDKAKNHQQALNMIEVADQQYSDLQKLQNVRERKRWLINFFLHRGVTRINDALRKSIFYSLRQFGSKIMWN